MFQDIIFNNQNQLKTYKIQLQFILILCKSNIVNSTYKLVILKIHRAAVVFDLFCLFVTKLPYMLRSVNHYFFYDDPLVYIIYIKVSHNLVI